MQTYEPRLKIHLVKAKPKPGLNFTELDITPWFADGSTITTTKSVRQEAGTFSFSFPDQLYQGYSLQELMAPMDFVEIRMTRDSTLTEIPLIMRGFVSRIADSERIEGGKPQRWLTITGHDYGKVLQLLQVVYLPVTITGQMYTDAFKWFEKYAKDTEVKIKPANDFVNEVLKYVLNPFLQQLTVLSKPSKTGMVINSLGNKSGIEGTVSPFSLSNFEDISLFDMLKKLLDVGAFNEMYTEDTDKSVDLVIRPAPMKDFYSGDFLQGTTESTSFWDIDLISPSRIIDDHSVANFFWLVPNGYSLITNETIKMTAAVGELQDFAIFDYKNANKDFYGIRKMQVELMLMFPDYAHSDSPTEDHHIKNKTDFNGWIRERRKLLMLMNRDNVVFESGSLHLKGDHKIKAGMYVKNEDSGYEAYAYSVTHTFKPFQSFFTTVQFDRGRFL